MTVEDTVVGLALTALVISLVVVVDRWSMRRAQRRVDQLNREMEAELSQVLGRPPMEPPPVHLHLR